MAENAMLDQLWYTWSSAGLGSMNVGYRVRAASPGLSDTNSMRYRRLDRLLRYELPQDIDPSTLDSGAAPISFMFMKNGDETLLIRKVVKGRDAANRYTVYFTHLIAGLPSSFTAREAISLWNHPFWADSEEGKAANDTHLPTIAYNQLEEYAREAQPTFHFATVREPLAGMIQTVLAHGLPSRISVEGQPALIAALIYGITHSLPKPMFADLTFSTYESNPKEGETLLIGSVKGRELTIATPLKIEMVQRLSNRPLMPAIPNYTEVAVESLIGANQVAKTKLNRIIAEAEKRDEANVENLLELFSRSFRQTTVSYQQMLEIVSNPQNKDNQEDLINPRFAQESAVLLLEKSDAWEKDGQPVFAKALQKIHTANALDPQSQAALTTFINAVAHLLLDAMKTAVLDARSTNNLDTLAHCTHVFSVLAPPQHNRQVWITLLQGFAQSPLYEAATSDALWNFQVWVLRCTARMESLPDSSIMTLWLSIPSWEKLDKFLGYDLPTKWEDAAAWNLLGRAIPRNALSVVQTHEARFKEILRWILQQQKPEYTEIVTNFFATLVTMGYSKRVELLLFLLKVTPGIMDGLLASMPPMTDRQLLAREIETLLEGCSPEVIAAANTSQILPVYIQQYVLDLKLDKISQEPVFLLLSQLNQGGMLPSPLASLVQNWLIIGHFLRSNQLSQGNLVQVGQALQAIMQTKQNEPGNSREQFINAFIPLLARKVESEHDLSNILDVLVPSLVDSRWGLLRRLARGAGQTFTSSKEFSRLTPYLLCGLREYANNNPQPPQSELDEYLRWLYGKMDERMLRSIEEGLSSLMWPDWMFREWDGWRKRAAPNLVQRILPGQKRQTLPLPIAGPPRLAQSDPNQPPSPLGQIKPPRPIGQVIAPALQSSTLATMKIPIAIAYLTAYKNHPIEGDYYRSMHTTMSWALRYWTTWLNENRDRGYAKTNAYEAATTLEILHDFQNHKDAVSRNLVNYLVDDLLIKADIEGLTKQNPQNSTFFDPNHTIDVHLRQLQTFAQELWNQPALQKYAEQALRLLIRRHLFLKYLEDGGERNLKRQIENRRKDAKVKYM